MPLDNLPQLAPVELVPGTCRSPIKDDPVNATFQYHLDRGRNDEQTVRPRTNDTHNDPSQDDNQSGSADTNRSGSSRPQNEDHDDTAAESESAISQDESEGQPSVGLSDPILAVSQNPQETIPMSATIQQDHLVEQAAGPNGLENTSPPESASGDGDTRVDTQPGTPSAEDLVTSDENLEGRGEQGHVTSTAVHDAFEETHHGRTQASDSPPSGHIHAPESSLVALHDTGKTQHGL